MNAVVGFAVVLNPDGNSHTIGFSGVPGRYGLFGPAAPCAVGADDNV